MFAAEIRSRRVDRMLARKHWRWHLDQVFVKNNGVTRCLWRAVNHEGEVLESFVTKTRDRKAALGVPEESDEAARGSLSAQLRPRNVAARVAPT